jgi:3-carboxy-cis,cis-muconate cycloisomerase
MIGVIDTKLFGDMFGHAGMRAVFDEGAFLARCTEAEVALAAAQARLGIIPAEAAAAIARRCDASALDMARMAQETEIVGYPILPLVHQLAAQCGDAGGYVHWGATTQDIMDIAVVLQVRAGLDLIEAMLTQTRDILAGLARKHRDTPMAGRTHLQHALPITFGYKAAVWLSGLDRHAERLIELRKRVLVVQFGGAAGTLASINDPDLALQLRAALARQLGLADPAITWHVARDGLAETVNALAMIGGTLGKIALDIMLMCSTEFGELAEPFVPGRGGSSTMPQKRNPISCELMLAASKALRQHAGLMLDAMVQDFERATGPWHLEWMAVPESFVLTAGALHQSAFMLQGLSVDVPRMRRNLDLTGGLIVSEAVMMALAPHVGRQQAHDRIYGACRTALESGAPVLDVLRQLPDVVSALGEQRLAELVDPMNYVGAAPAMVDQLLAGRT